ncbi:MAG TPA: hypothetical protein VNQ76_09125 [Planctomicrobium sp.]|nr:hypothetical protein [Planctomicrobium sp.]
MRRFRQQTWFCIAAVWLAGSISMYWAYDVNVAPDDLVQTHEKSQRQVLRRHQDLEAVTTETQYLTNVRTRTSRPAAGFPKQEESKSVHPRPGVVRLPDTAPSRPTPAVERVGYERFPLLEDVPNTGKTRTVWFRGQIELVE